jgi:hypothetical protein
LAPAAHALGDGSTSSFASANGVVTHSRAAAEGCRPGFSGEPEFDRRFFSTSQRPASATMDHQITGAQ